MGQLTGPWSININGNSFKYNIVLIASLTYINEHIYIYAPWGSIVPHGA